jgi:hypothetical protein
LEGAMPEELNGGDWAKLCMGRRLPCFSLDGSSLLSLRMARRVVILCLALLVLCGGGCYKRVVSSKGFGGMGTTIQDSYRSDTAADRAVDNATGNGPKTVRGADTMPVTKRTYWTDSPSGKNVRP